MMGSHSPGWSVDLGPRADANPLAREIRRRIVASLEHGGGLRAFRRMWGTIVILAVSPDSSGAPTHTTLTLRFDWGRLMIHEGRVGRPDVTLWGSAEAILALGLRARPSRAWRADQAAVTPDAPAASSSVGGGGLTGKLRRGWTSARKGRRASRDWPRDVKIYGLGFRPRFVWRFARLLAPT